MRIEMKAHPSLWECIKAFSASLPDEVVDAYSLQSLSSSARTIWVSNPLRLVMLVAQTEDPRRKRNIMGKSIPKLHETGH